MQGSLLLVVLLSVCVVLSMGKVSVMEYDVDILPAISLNAATPVNEVGDIWSNCGKTGDEMHIKNVTISPDPPQKGKNITVTATITSDEEITDGEVKADIKWGVITVLNKTYKLCDLLKEMNQTCPIPVGTRTNTLEQTVPGFTPSGHYTGKITGTDQNGKGLMCIDIDLHL